MAHANPLIGSKHTHSPFLGSISVRRYLLCALRIALSALRAWNFLLANVSQSLFQESEVWQAGACRAAARLNCLVPVPPRPPFTKAWATATFEDKLDCELFIHTISVLLGLWSDSRDPRLIARPHDMFPQARTVYPLRPGRL